ncbi:MAG: hypothetical protein U0Y82_05085 [Thermoleophilia bacterium]
MACGLVVALVAASVFSIGYRSRQVVARAASLNSVDETLRSITVVRSQIGFAALLRSVDLTYGTDSRTAIASSTQDAQQAIGGVKAAMESADGSSPLARPATVLRLDRFMVVAGHALTAIRTRDARRGQRGVADLETAFTTARSALTAGRDDLLEQIQGEDDRLWRLGALATFIVAFVVPACAVGIFVLLTHRTREDQEREFMGRGRTSRGRRRARVVDAALTELRRAITTGDARAGSAPEDLLSDLEALVGAGRAGMSRTLGSVDLDELLADVAGATTTERTTVTARGGEHVAWCDPDALRQILVNLVREATSRGARTVEIMCAYRAPHVQVAVAHDGAALPQALAAALGGDAWDAPELGPRLTAAMVVAGSVGARLGALSDPRPALLVGVTAVESGDPQRALAGASGTGR